MCLCARLPHHEIHSITSDTFQYLLDKRESRQAITIFLDQASCSIINFYLEADEEVLVDGSRAGLKTSVAILCYDSLLAIFFLAAVFPGTLM